MIRPIVALAPIAALALLTLTACSSAPPPPPAVTTAAPASLADASDVLPDDRATIMQAVLDVTELQQYFHVEVLPERRPLRLVDNGWLPTRPELSKFDDAVVYESASDKPHIELTRLEIDGDKARVQFSYDVEGVVGDVRLHRNLDGWIVSQADLAER